ncbi:hypothetical protein OC834_007692 [Tilletia horrida]|nr:hypothetical protein OC834_007692 [Tilletia horrida]
MLKALRLYGQLNSVSSQHLTGHTEEVLSPFLESCKLLPRGLHGLGLGSALNFGGRLEGMDQARVYLDLENPAPDPPPRPFVYHPAEIDRRAVYVQPEIEPREGGARAQVTIDAHGTPVEIGGLEAIRRHPHLLASDPDQRIDEVGYRHMLLASDEGAGMWGWEDNKMFFLRQHSVEGFFELRGDPELPLSRAANPDPVFEDRVIIGLHVNMGAGPKVDDTKRRTTCRCRAGGGEVEVEVAAPVQPCRLDSS